MMPSRDQTGVPIHFHSSMMFASALRMTARTWASILPRQSPSFSMRLSINSEARLLSPVLGFFIDRLRFTSDSTVSHDRPRPQPLVHRGREYADGQQGKVRTDRDGDVKLECRREQADENRVDGAGMPG